MCDRPGVATILRWLSHKTILRGTSIIFGFLSTNHDNDGRETTVVLIRFFVKFRRTLHTLKIGKTCNKRLYRVSTATYFNGVFVEFFFFSASDYRGGGSPTGMQRTFGPRTTRVCPKRGRNTIGDKLTDQFCRKPFKIEFYYAHVTYTTTSIYTLETCCCTCSST